MAKSIPDRWIPYRACGKVIEGTRIICFKVPLKKCVQENNKNIKEIWDIKSLLEKIPNLGGVVDLTNTARYYNPADLKTAGVLHVKILMLGRVIPPENKVKQFMDTIDEFLGKSRDVLVGVHCTHGLNRTGYMVCRYMRDRLGIPAREAIRRFEKARGYKIERENYIADILGKNPVAPDVGKKKTIVTPIDKQTMEYRSPLGQYEEEDYDERKTNGYRNRYNKKFKTPGNRYNSNESQSSSSRWDMSEMSHRPYSYKHDY
ncbi:RNA/RNP complex-1-interacting phosphatase [Choristoneura fumiferana]|uniref:RNA/RNP complex-1-interacting phosphatase n=1 Tax=Choristoneura fumiferana TaxID=7141 RepID=UPI003D154CE5